jgi:hypothetical protein
MVMRETGWRAIAETIGGQFAAVFLIRLVKSVLYSLKPSDQSVLDLRFYS